MKTDVQIQRHNGGSQMGAWPKDLQNSSIDKI